MKLLLATFILGSMFIIEAGARNRQVDGQKRQQSSRNYRYRSHVNGNYLGNVTWSCVRLGNAPAFVGIRFL
ncbi:hypothetical protein BIW11_12584 [Tropilaelaps mercedesae]|uniref:Uncharacterized protein n=1 Tax=Tropilaelaps mercedesae TaxID=418985 RepID=A0A1V9X6C7_9ACAR|nr:hypothetical protein BIW11_12584 [Tropilaelaps mercedesae]